MAPPSHSCEGAAMRSPLLFALLALATPALAQEPLTPGTVSVEPLADDAGPPPVRAAFAEAVATALADKGLLALPGPGGRHAARVTLTRTPRGEVAVKGKALDPSASLGNWGAGAVVAIGGKPENRRLMVTELTIEIVPRGATDPAWRGRAVSVQPEGTKDDAAGALAPKLAAAAMRAFPAAYEGTVPVP